MKVIHIILFALFLPASGYSAEPEEADHRYHVSLVYVGSRSNHYWDGIGINQKLYRVDPGAEPPENLVVTTARKVGSASKVERKSTRSTLNATKDYIAITGHICKIEKMEVVQNEASYSAFATINLPGKAPGPYSVFISRVPGARTWENPQHLVLPDSEQAFPKGSVRVVNLSDRKIWVAVNDKPAAIIAPGKISVLRSILSLENPPKVELLYIDKKKKATAFRRPLRFSSDSRKSIACVYVPLKRKAVSAALLSTKALPHPGNAGTLGADARN